MGNQSVWPFPSTLTFVLFWFIYVMSLITLNPWTIGVFVDFCLQCRRPGFDPWVGKIPWRRKWQPTPVFLPGEYHGQRSLAGYIPWGLKESHMTERISTAHIRSVNALFLKIKEQHILNNFSMPLEQNVLFSVFVAVCWFDFSVCVHLLTLSSQLVKFTIFMS